MKEVRRRHLRLIGAGTKQKPPKGKPVRMRFSDAHRHMLAVAITSLKQSRFGTWRALAEALDMPQGTLHQVCAGRAGSMALAYRVAALAGVPLDVLLTGKIVAADRCRECGQPLPGVKC